MNKFWKRIAVLFCNLLIIASLSGCASGNKDNLTEYKNGERICKSDVVPTTECEKIIAESFKDSISDDFNKIREYSVEREVSFEDQIKIAEEHQKQGYYVEAVTIHSFARVTRETYTNKESGIKYYEYLDKLNKANPYESEVVEVNYTVKLTEEYNKVAQFPSGTYTRYYVMIKENKYADFKIFDVYGHM